MARRHPPTAWLSRASLVLAAACTMLVIRSTDSLANQTQVELVLLACVAYLAMLAADHRWGGLTIGAVAAAGAATAVVALSVPAHFTGDLWSYAMYGRIVAAHHASPYAVLPAHFPSDPMLYHVGRSWRHTYSVYGPAFTAFSAVAALSSAPRPRRPASSTSWSRSPRSPARRRSSGGAPARPVPSRSSPSTR